MSEILSSNMSDFFFFFKFQVVSALTKIRKRISSVSKKAKLASLSILPRGQALRPKEEPTL